MRFFDLHIAAITMLAATCVVGGELNRDPFQPPAEFAASNDSGRARPAALEIGLNPQIKGILFAGNRSLVNLSGKIIGLGEEVDGYKLLEVSEDRAVFRHGDETLILQLYREETDE